MSTELQELEAAREQQGVREQFEVVAKRLHIPLATWGGEWKYISTINAYQMFQEGWQAALAASQPGAQVPAAIELTCGHEGWSVKPFDAFGLPIVGRKVTVYTAPPAQGIDLEQFRNAVEFHLMHAEQSSEVVEGERMLALIDSQSKV